MKKIKFNIRTIIMIAIASNFGCKKLVEVDLPVNQITAEATYGNLNTAIAAINGVYASLAASDRAGIMTFSLGYAADELKYEITYENDRALDYRNDFANPASSFFSVWNHFYGEEIYRLNSIIEGVSKSNSIADRQKNVIIAEAKFTRAFVYFYLVNLYGPVPLVLSTDFKTNSNVPRSQEQDVYTQIIKDLNDAQAYLPNSYLGPDLLTITVDRVRPTKMAATALLSRVYLFHKDWNLAEQMATELISDSKFKLLNLNDVFQKNSLETIWALQPNFINAPGNFNNPVENCVPKPGDPVYTQVSSYLYNAFEPLDQRKYNWIGTRTIDNVDYNFPFKYKAVPSNTQDIQAQEEYSVIFRLSEQYLIRAEARAEQGRVSGTNSATEDLDVVRNRAGLFGTAATTKNEVLEAILHERQVEFFGEWGGYRWLDLKRTKQIDNVMSQVAPLKGGIWNSYKALFPIPYYEFTTNPALKNHQNPGYTERF